MTKKEARTKYKEKRQALPHALVQQMSLEIANKSLDAKGLWNYETYHIFLSIEKQNEVNTDYMLHILQGKDKNIVVARSNFESYSMQHFLLTEQTTLQTNKWGIPEPNNGIKVEEQQIDVVFVPLLVADINGQRIGYGKGFYDRFLALCKPDVLKVGLGFFSPLQEELKDTHLNDIPLDMLITPKNIYHFNEKGVELNKHNNAMND